jgi:hypothetical protein
MAKLQKSLHSGRKRCKVLPSSLQGSLPVHNGVVMRLEGGLSALARSTRWPWRCLALGIVVGLAGCGTGPNVIPLSKAEKSLTNIALAYGEAHARLGHGPKDAEELKPYLKEFGNPDELLISPNDGEPFVVVWGANPRGGPTDYKQIFPVLAYEKKGTRGKRALTDIRGRPMTIPTEDFSKLTFVGGHRPSPN